MKITLSMICKDELENLKRLKPLVEDYIDEWVVVFPPKDPAISWAKKNGIKAVVKDFTQAIEPEIIEKFKDYELEVDPEYRLFRFADARNESFSHASGDYILWLDADDEPVGLERLSELLKEKEADIFEAVYEYAHDEEDNPIADHIRERVVKNDDSFVWEGGKYGLIHETLSAKEGRPKYYQVPKDQFKVLHQTDHAEQSKNRNHVALLYEYIKDGTDARTIYYLGTSFFNMGQFELCVKTLLEYVEVGGWDEERYRAWIRIAEAYHQLGDRESSRNAYLNATKELPHYPDAWHGLGESYFSSEDYGKAIEFLMTGIRKPIPKTKSAIDHVKYMFRPLPFLALASMYSGQLQEAFDWFSKAKKVNPDHPWVNNWEDLFVEMRDLDEYIKSFVRIGQIANKYYPETMPYLAEAIPDKLKDQDILLDFKRRYSKPKEWSDNSVVFFCSRAFEEWGPDSLKTGTGGSEEAVIHLSERFAKMGWDVTVFNNCPKEERRNGVNWVRYERFNPNDEFNILISWRNNAFLTPKSARKKFIDIHDVPTSDIYTKKSLEDVTLLVKSQYHRSLLPNIPDENFAIINNGIDTEQFPDTEKTKNNLVWTSSYDRGLEYLLKMWPDIKTEVPDATLDVYYGFNLFDSSPWGKTDEGKRWKQKMLELLDQDGITEHGRVNSEEVAKAYLKADVWAYPTDFPEIDCITATKAMAAKCVPITTDYAVLKERNQGVMIDSSKEDWQDTFKKELIDVLKDDKRKEDIRDKLDVTKFDWDDVAKRWSELFEAR